MGQEGFKNLLEKKEKKLLHYKMVITDKTVKLQILWYEYLLSVSFKY